MSSLQRYKKSGGFFQLLSLIETFGPQKKEKFLEMIEAESPVWARALREKMVTVERMYKWPDDTFVEVFKQLPVKSMAYALEGIAPEQKARVLTYFSASEQRRLSDVMTENQPKPEEVASTLVKLVETVRRMLNERELYPEKFDESLVIPEEFEAALEAQAAGFGGGASAADVAELMLKVAPAAPAAGGAAPAAASNTAEVTQLKTTLALMVKENKTLKDEVRGLRDKLEQIKRIA